LCDQVIQALAETYKAVYVDATHNETADENVNGKMIVYTSHPAKDELHIHKKLNTFHFRHLFAEADFALVNGNHLQAKAQVLIIDGAKRSSLQKRVSQLTDVQLIILINSETEIFDFIKDALPGWNTLPVIQISETDKIISFFQSRLKERQPQLNGLVLAGGESSRMGHDKTLIHWHGKEQRYYIADLIRPFCNQVFISCRNKQQAGITEDYESLEDSFTGLGPYGAILSAFRHNPDAAWLVIASDLPLLDSDTIAQLTDNRKTAAIATTFAGNDDLPEPLITIWEPKSYPLLLANLAQGYSCPRKLLLNNDTHIIQANNPKALMNVNTPEQAKEATSLLEKKILS
jgi:molybdopterin-guanine dinucleotide biosynthesis protein A